MRKKKRYGRRCHPCWSPAELQLPTVFQGMKLKRSPVYSFWLEKQHNIHMVEYYAANSKYQIDHQNTRSGRSQ